MCCRGHCRGVLPPPVSPYQLPCRAVGTILFKLSYLNTDVYAHCTVGHVVPLLSKVPSDTRTTYTEVRFYNEQIEALKGKTIIGIEGVVTPGTCSALPALSAISLCCAGRRCVC